MSSLTKWRSWLSGLPQFVIHTDHQGLQYFQTKQKLNARQARWQQGLAEFNFVVKYKPGPTMQRADALTRKCGSAKEGIELQFFPDGTITDNYNNLINHDAHDGPSPRMMQILALEQSSEPDDPLIGSTTECGILPLDTNSELDVGSWARNDAGLLIPPDKSNKDGGDLARPGSTIDSKLEVLRACHDSGSAGHWGRHRTQELVSRNFWWEGWKEDVAAYVPGCQRCQLAKADRHSKATQLLPMPTGIQPWEEISMDFVGELSESEGFNMILVITDRFTKMQRYIPAKNT